MKRLKEVMTADVEVVFAHSSIREAAEKMKSLDAGMLPVCDNDRLVGTITDRDIAIRAVSVGRNPEQTKVRDVMTRELVYLFEDESVERAAQMMQSKQIRRLIILNRNKRLCGIVSLGDLAVEAGVSLAGKTLERISKFTTDQTGIRHFLVSRGMLPAFSIFVGGAALAGSFIYMKQRRFGLETNFIKRIAQRAA